MILSKLDRKQLDKLVSQRERIISDFGKLLQKPSFIQDLKAGDTNSVTRRIEAIRKLVKEIL